MRNRGLYHQAEGSERRTSSQVFAERMADNQTVEGKEVFILRNLFKTGQYANSDLHIARLKREGMSFSRISAVVSQATYGIRLA